MVFLLPDETRSACGASEDLSASCVGGASLCDYDAKSRYRQVNRFSCQYRLFTSDLRSCTTAPPLGLLSASAAVSRGVEEKVFRFPLVLLPRSLVEECAVEKFSVVRLVDFDGI